MKVDIGPFPHSERKERKIEIQIDDYDLWNLDHTLSLIIVKCLELLLKEEGSWPGCFENIEEWQECLKAMIYSFREIVENNPNEPTFEGDWEDSKDAVEEYQKKIDKGLLLFAKHFQSLWT